MTGQIFTLISKKEGYLLCLGMKRMINRALKKRDAEAEASDGKTNTTTVVAAPAAAAATTTASAHTNNMVDP